MYWNWEDQTHLLYLKTPILKQPLTSHLNQGSQIPAKYALQQNGFLFEDDIFESALNLFKEKTQSMIHYGDPLNESTTIGPLARIDIKNNLQIQLNNAELTKENIAYEYSTNDHLGNFFPPHDHRWS